VLTAVFEVFASDAGNDSLVYCNNTMLANYFLLSTPQTLALFIAKADKLDKELRVRES